MIAFAERVSRIESSITLEMTARAAQLRAAGVDIINMSVGEPDFPTPQHIIEAAKRAIDEGYTRYTPGPGIPALREAIALKLKRDNQIEVTSEEVIVCNGGKHALHTACMALFEKGDEVIIFSPYWVSFPDLVKLANATPIIVSSDPEQQFAPDFKELESRITSRTKGIIVNSPSNPTGGVWSREAMERIVGITREHGLWLLSDECYEALSYDRPFESPLSLAPQHGKILTFQSCSKTYAMTGWRIGYMAGPKEVVQAMSRIQGQATSCPNSISQMAAIAALTGDQSLIEERKGAFRNRRSIMVDRLNDIPTFSCRKPGGAFYVFLNVSELFGKTMDNMLLQTPKDVTEFLIDHVRVIGVNGEAFGDQEHIRLSYAVSEKEIVAAIERIDHAVACLN
jgi:aspartate aminotransferase